MLQICVPITYERKIITEDHSIYAIIQVTNELIREVYRMRRKEDRTSQILELLVKEKKLDWASPRSLSAKIWTPWRHRD